MSRTRLQRKAAKVNRSEVEKAFYAELAAARAQRDKLVTKLRNDFHKEVLKLEEKFNAERKDVSDEYQKQRVALIKKYAKQEEQQAAAA